MWTLIRMSILEGYIEDGIRCECASGNLACCRVTVPGYLLNGSARVAVVGYMLVSRAPWTLNLVQGRSCSSYHLGWVGSQCLLFGV